MTTLSIQNAKGLIESKLMDATSGDAKIYLVFQGMENPYELTDDDDAIVKVAVNFGRMVDGEKGYSGVTRRQGVLSLSVYTLYGTGSGRNLDICQLLENTFRRISLSAVSGEEVLFDSDADPYTEGGYLTEVTKLVYHVHAPFWFWVGNN